LIAPFARIAVVQTTSTVINAAERATARIPSPTSRSRPRVALTAVWSFAAGTPARSAAETRKLAALIQ